jgi:prevent-host-death family protein
MLAQEMIGISEAKAKLSALVKRLESGQQERVLLLKQDRPVAVILPIGPYERMVELEERIEFLEDALAVARAEAINDGTVSDARRCQGQASAGSGSV